MTRRSVKDAEFNRDGPEIWRDLSLAAETQKGQFNEIYCHPRTPEFALSDCRDVTENCFRVRSLPEPGESERWMEFRFRPEARAIVVTAHPTSHASVPGGSVSAFFGMDSDGNLGLSCPIQTRRLTPSGSSPWTKPLRFCFNRSFSRMVRAILFIRRNVSQASGSSQGRV